MRPNFAWLSRCATSCGVLSSAGTTGSGLLLQQRQGACAAATLFQQQRLRSGHDCSTSAEDGAGLLGLWSGAGARAGAGQSVHGIGTSSAATSSSDRSNQCGSCDESAVSSSSSGSVNSRGSSSPWLSDGLQQLPGRRERQHALLPRAASFLSHQAVQRQPHYAATMAAAAAAAAASPSRAYARVARHPRPRADGRDRDRGGERPSSSAPRSGAAAAPAPALLGRRAAGCPLLHELPAATAQTDLLKHVTDPWKHHSPFNQIDPDGQPGPLPRTIDTVKEDPLQFQLFFREQVEKSPLPAEVKRAAFDQPWEETLIDTRRTVKVTAKGRLETLHVTTAVGNMRGLVGVGMSSGSEIQQVTLNSIMAAYKNVLPVPMYRAHTIYHPIDLQIRKLRIRMWPRPRGFGITASPLIETLCNLAGIKDITVKLNGRRRNIDNVVKAWLQAVASQGAPHDGVEGSGVYVREVYHREKLPAGLRRGVDF